MVALITTALLEAQTRQTILPPAAANVLQRYLHALQAQDTETIRKIAVPSHAPFLLDFKIVDTRALTKQAFPEESTHNLNCGFEPQRKEQLLLTMKKLEDELLVVREQMAEIIRLSPAEDEQIRAGRQKRFTSLSDQSRIIHKRMDETQAELTALDHARICAIKEEVDALTLLSLSMERSYEQSEFHLLALDSYNVIVDMEIQSQAGFRLTKKHEISLQRVCEDRPKRICGKWVVAELSDLSGRK
jgi:hypothetical protein